MELGRDPDVRRNVQTDPLLTPQPKAQEKPSAAEQQHAKKKKVHILHILSHTSTGSPFGGENI